MVIEQSSFADGYIVRSIDDRENNYNSYGAYFRQPPPPHNQVSRVMIDCDIK